MIAKHCPSITKKCSLDKGGGKGPGCIAWHQPLGIVKHLESLSEEDVMELNLPNCIPIIYELNKNLNPIKPTESLGAEETVWKNVEAVTAQDKVKK